METSLILLEGRAATSEKELDMLLEQLQEVSVITAVLLSPECIH